MATGRSEVIRVVEMAIEVWIQGKSKRLNWQDSVMGRNWRGLKGIGIMNNS